MRKLLIAAAAALTAYGVYRLVREDGSPEEEARVPEVPIPFGKFLEDCVTVDRLDGRTLADWARPLEAGEVCVAAFPCRDMLDEFGITGCPAELDSETNLLQFVLDTETGNVRKARLVSFGEMSGKVKDLFNGQKYFILRG
ncbi:MAG: hypothetical protein IKI84_09445 [Clostridia bacterium]|nr:hypothetical protein [Clostridia bacterium]